MAEKVKITEVFYVIPRGKRFSYSAVVHRAGCPALAHAKHARKWDHNPLDQDKFGNYTRCTRCNPMASTGATLSAREGRNRKTQHQSVKGKRK